LIQTGWQAGRWLQVVKENKIKKRREDRQKTRARDKRNKINKEQRAK
jgi:hypothetical protein